MTTPTSAETIRAAYGADIPVTLPGGHVVQCRRPDLDDALFRGVLPLPLLKAMFTEIRGVLAGGPDQLQQSVEAFLEAGAAGTAAMVDIWVCLAAKNPKVVTKEAEAVDGALWIGELPLVAKLAIFGATFDLGEAARQAAASSFRPEPDGAAPGPGREAVPGPPVVDVEHH